MGNCALPSQIANCKSTRESSIIYLLMMNEFELVKQKIMFDKFPINQSINFRGDTLLHYACARQDERLVNYLLSYPEIIVCQKNSMGQIPKDLTNNPKIHQILS